MVQEENRHSECRSGGTKAQRIYTQVSLVSLWTLLLEASKNVINAQRLQGLRQNHEKASASAAAAVRYLSARRLPATLDHEHLSVARLPHHFSRLPSCPPPPTPPSPKNLSRPSADPPQP